MAFSILAEDTRAKLEQERDRLINERDAIIEAAVTQATAEIDQTLQQINHLLGSDSPTETASNSKKAPTQSKPKAATQSKPKAAPKSQKAAAKANPVEVASEPKESKSTATTQSLTLKRTFKSMTPTQAVQQIMQGASEPMTTDDVIGSLYQSVKEADLKTARKSVALILGRGSHQGIYEKVQENPSRYQIKA